MNIVFVFASLAGRCGGAERFVAGLANNLSSRGHLVTIVTRDQSRDPPFYAIDKAVKIINIFDQDGVGSHKGVFNRGGIKWWRKNKFFITRVRAFIKEYKPDIVVAFMPSATTTVGISAFNLGVPTVASFHGEPAADFDNVKRWSRSRTDRYLRRRVLYLYDAITVLSEGHISWFPRNIRNRIVDIPNPVENLLSEESRIRENVVLGVGRLVKSKGYDLLISAWHEIHKLFPLWRVEIFGDGPEKNNLCGLIERFGISDTVRINSPVDAIYKEYLSSKIMCHPSEFEGFGLSVAESLSAGLPVVGFSDAPGVNRLVVDGVNGILVSADGNRCSALAAGLAKLMADDNLRNRLALDAPRTVCSFDPCVVYDRWDDMLKNTYDNKRKSL